MEGDPMKKFLMFVLVLFAALAFSYTIASPAENKNDIPIVFDVGPPVTNQLFDVAIERSPQESRQHSFTFGEELSHISHTFTASDTPINRNTVSESRRPPNLVLLS